jgi:hypothetical protein
MPKLSGSTQTQLWQHRVMVTRSFADNVPNWKEIVEERLRQIVQKNSGCLSLELEELIDERETSEYKYFGPTWQPHRQSDAFYLYGVYRVTLPRGKTPYTGTE